MVTEITACLDPIVLQTGNPLYRKDPIQFKYLRCLGNQTQIPLGTQI